MNLTDPVFTKSADHQSYHVTHACACGHVSKGDIQAADLFKWRQGALPQAAFPYLSSTQIEALFITGMCGFCWADVFADEEEDDEPDEFPYEHQSQSGEQYYADMINSDSYIAYLNG